MIAALFVWTIDDLIGLILAAVFVAWIVTALLFDLFGQLKRAFKEWRSRGKEKSS